MAIIPRIPEGRDAIGGYFAVESGLGPGAGSLHAQAEGFQSARAAFLDLLQAVRPSRVWLPWYLCDSMAEPLGQAGVAAARYALEADFSVPAGIPLAPHELLLAVNYFGLLEPQLALLPKLYPAAQIVIDQSQALYSPPLPVLANIYSPRKFVGIPDGGLLVAPGTPLAASAPDQGSIARASHLWIRRELGAEAGYSAFTAAEQTLSGAVVAGMSEFTRLLLAGVAHDRIRLRRRENFASVARQLDRVNEFSWRPHAQAVPLCYPLLVKGGEELRRQLWQARVYAACYWPELLDPASGCPAQEQRWARDLIALPIDQRYAPDTLERDVAGPLLACIG